MAAVLIATVMWSGAAFAGPADVLPPDGFNGWKKVEKPRVYNQADLYGYIDGGAELFFEFGFEQLTIQKYRNGGDELSVEAYRMKDPGAAFGIYLAKAGKETPDARFAVRHTMNAYQLMFARNQYYVIVNNPAGKASLAGAVLAAAQHVSSQLPATPAPAELKLLPPARLVKESVRLIRGPVALQTLYTLGAGDILQLNGRLTAVAGEYQADAANKYLLIVVNYPTADAARAAFLSVQTNLDKYLKPTNKTDRRLVFQDFARKYGVIAVAGARMEIRLNLAKPPSA